MKKESLNEYRLAGAAGGLLLAAGQFYGPLCVLQLGALVPIMVLTLRDRSLGRTLLAGFYMAIAFTLPQMVYLLMPVPVTVILLLYFMVLLLGLCACIVLLLPRHPVWGPLAVGAAWYLLDWINYTAVPIWGMAQSFARSWTAYPFAVSFISVTGISGVLFVTGTLQGLAAHWIRGKNDHKPLLITAAGLATVLLIANSWVWMEKPTDSLRVAAAGWVFDDRSDEIDPHKAEGFQKLFAEPARQAASQGVRLFTTGEMGFYIARHEWDMWMERFAAIARDNDLWLAVGYFNIDLDENRVFFMSPEGVIVHEYTKTYLTPFEPGHRGRGDLKTVEIDGLTVGAMICQDDNFSRLTRHYATLKADLILCPTADWRTIKDGHMQAVRARAIEGNYGIVRGAACGISAAISPRGQILAKRDHYQSGSGFVIADIPVRKSKTLFARFGHWPGLIAAGALIAAVSVKRELFGLSFLFSRIPDDGKCVNAG